MRCPDCQKFVSMETEAEEVESIEAELEDAAVLVTASVRVVRNCAECSTELKSLSIESDTIVEMAEEQAKCLSHQAVDGAHDVTVEDGDCQASESAGGRYKKNMIGFDLTFTIGCENEGCELKLDDTISAAEPASAFEESV